MSEKEILLAAIDDELKSIELSAEVHKPLLLDGEYAIPMAWSCAEKHGNEIVNHVPRYSSADHGTNFKVLMSFVHQRIAAKDGAFLGPYFDRALVADPFVTSSLGLEANRLFVLNAKVSVQRDYWQVSRIDERFRVSLAPSIRRSALHLLAIKAEYLSYREEIREALASRPSKVDPAQFTLISGDKEVLFLRQAVPEAWAAMETRLGFSVENAKSFLAFAAFLFGYHFRWFTADELWEAWQEYVEKYRQAQIDQTLFLRLLDFLSITVEGATSWGVSGPIVKIGEWYAVWPFAYHVLPPALFYLSLIMRKASRDWDETVGSEMALVADYIGGMLEKFPDLRIATRRKKKPFGDIDIGIYNTRTKQVILCEIKTVFDRFRTNYQLSNFAEQKVNFAKAEQQLRTSQRAIALGHWKLSEIFGKGVPDDPVEPKLIVLTWHDVMNPWAGIPTPDIASCNFIAFQYLYAQSRGELGTLFRVLTNLASTFCAARLLDGSFGYKDKKIECTVEVQTDALPPYGLLMKTHSDEFVLQELKTLARFPDDWKEQLPADDPPHRFHFYLPISQ